MKTISNIIFALVAIAMVTSCNTKGTPNYQYFPNMYESVGYEAYSSHEVFADNNTSEALKPVNGTVHRGWLPYDYANSAEGYASAKAGLKNPLAYTAENNEKGKELYNIYCAICHGEKGNGKGTLVKREKILGVPSYDDAGRNITEGSIYHVMYWGINSMGSYASQTSTEERWQIVQYVEGLKASLLGVPARVDKEGALKKVMENDSLHAAAASDHHSEEMTDEHSEAVDADEKDTHEAGSHKPLLGGKSHHSHKESTKN